MKYSDRIIASHTMHLLLATIAVSSLVGYTYSSENQSMTESNTTVGTQLNTAGYPLLSVGDTIKDFTIPTPYSPTGSEEISLGSLLEKGPVVLTFFRGSWCPYCRGELSDIQDNIEKFNKLGATVLAISPESGDKSEELADKLDIGFYIGHDENNELASSLGLTFELDSKTIEKYKGYNINVPEANGTQNWELPIPATYIIDQDFTVKFVFDDENYSKRASYKKLVKVVKEIQTED